MDNINLDKIIKAEELDYNMVLSVPEEIGIKLQRIIQGTATAQEKNSTNIQLIENTSDYLDIDESRKLIFKINDILLPITLLDLPCVIEAQKTMDYKTFYKSGDISQMLFVHDKEMKLNSEDEIATFDPFKSNDQVFQKLVWKKDYDHKYKLKHGLSKATKNVRSRRFKRKVRYNHEEILEVAKKLKSIIDNGAASFENQMKNKESVDNETMSGKITFNEKESENLSIDNQSSSNIINITTSIGGQNGSELKKGTSNKKKKKIDNFNAPANIATKKNNFNITLNLNESSNVTKKPQEKQASQISRFTINQESENVEMNENLDDELHREYYRIKEDYMKIKKELEENPEAAKDSEKVKHKKKLKKRLKQIKEDVKKQLQNK